MIDFRRAFVLLLCAFTLSCGSPSGVSFLSGLSSSSSVVPGGTGGSHNTTPAPRQDLLTEHRTDVSVTGPPGLGAATIVTLGGEVPLTGGAANVVYYNQGHQLSIVSDAAGNPVMLGWVGPDETTVSLQTTAAVIMYFRLGGPLLTSDIQHLLIVRLREHPSVVKLAQALEAILAVDPQALTHNPTELKNAVELAATELKDVSINRVQVEPVNGSGITVDTGEGGTTLRLRNAFRRRAYAYVQQVGSYPQSPGGPSALNPVTPPRPVAEFDISPVSGVTSTFGTIANLLTGNIPYTPVLTEPVQVPVVNNQGQDDPEVEATQYQVLVLGLGQPSSNDSKISQVQRDKLNEVSLKTLFIDFLFPIINSVILPVGSQAAESDASVAFAQFLGNTLPDLITAFGAAVDSALPRLRAGDYQGAINELLYSQVGGNNFRGAIAEWVRKGIEQQLVAQGRPVPPGMDKALERFAKVTVILDGILTVVDSTAQAISVVNSKSVEEFTVRSRRGRLNINPYSAQVDQFSRQDFSVSVADPPEALVYHYTLQTVSGNPNGRLTSTNAAGDSLSGREFETPSKTVTYIPGGFSLGKEKLVVEAIQVTPAPRTSIATQEAEIEVVSANVQLVPRKASITSEQVLPLTLVASSGLGIDPQLATYEWNTSGGMCVFRSGQSTARQFGLVGDRIDLICTAPPNQQGTQRVSVKIFQPDQDGQLQIRGAASAEYKVNEARKTILFGSGYGESHFSISEGWYSLGAGAGWLIPVAADEDQVLSYSVYIYNWTDGGPTQRTRSFSFAPGGAERLTVPSSTDRSPRDGEVSMYLPANPVSDIRVGGGAYKFGWTGFVGFGPLGNGDPIGPSPTALIHRVSPSTVEVTVTYRP